jgi:type IV secretory pathway VirB2 component (pilin)
MMRSLYLAVLSLVVATTAIAPANAQQRTAYPREFVEQYVNSCSSGQTGQARAICQCMIAGIQRRYTYQQFQRLNEAIARTGKIQDANLNQIIQACRANSNTYSSRSLRFSLFKARF